ncbi:MAG: porphobilinogen synthase, partial [Candidatus Sumerlaeia bacterium]|nr:porphobilinogen synthase [Candidatus Sumerlaeia bacterium]
MTSFPDRRMRRLRYNPILRKMIAETELSLRQLIYPLFVVPGSNYRKEILSMPGVFNLSIDQLVSEVKELAELGISAIILFGVPEKKDERGTEAYSSNGIIQRALRAIKKEVKDVLVITDVCLCEYTSSGHCGIVKNGEIQNDETLELLA